MKAELETICGAYAANREAVKAAFRWDNKALYSVGANIFCAAGKPAEAERLKECRQVIKKHTRIFSKFRNSKVRAILASMTISPCCAGISRERNTWPWRRCC